MPENFEHRSSGTKAVKQIAPVSQDTNSKNSENTANATLVLAKQGASAKSSLTDEEMLKIIRMILSQDDKIDLDAIRVQLGMDTRNDNKNVKSQELSTKTKSESKS